MIGYTIDHCLSEKINAQCEFEANFIVVVIVACCNIVKASVMLYVALRLRGQPLITVGDAVESFLDEPDPTTRSLCLATQAEIRTKFHGGIMFQKRSSQWKDAVSGRRWFWFVVLMLLTSGAVTACLVAALRALKSVQGTKIGDLWDVGFGAVTGSNLITGWALQNITNLQAQLIGTILIANLPQTILSFLYFQLNGVLTTMSLAKEWSEFSQYPGKPLRVSQPKPGQRNTYFLQLPYRIAVPLMILSGILHWLVSQSLFLASVKAYDYQGNPSQTTSFFYYGDDVSILTCGFSPFPMIIVLIIALVIVVGTCVIGFGRTSSPIPLAGSCSAVISAACHPLKMERDITLKPIAWGVVPNFEIVDGVGHCSFSSEPVEQPIVGVKYA